MELILSGILAFVSTNIDDIFVLMLFFGNNRYQTKEVVIGQYLGIIALIAISFIGSLAGLLVSQSYIGMLGFVPIYLGIKGFIDVLKKGSDESKIDVNDATTTNKHSNIFSVAAITFANGGDNIGIYIPLFATLSLSGKLMLIAIFLGMVAVWCFVAKYLSKHPIVARAINRYGHIVTPVILILLGIYILYESGSLRLIGTIIYELKRTVS